MSFLTMSLFVRSILIKFTFSKRPVLLGRWNLDYCPNIVNRKVTFSNEDHCGTCGTYMTHTLPKIQMNISEEKEQEEMLQYMVTEIHI
jgi:hypothetical protein